MGYLASELNVILTVRAPEAPWAILSRMGVHPDQIARLQIAAEDFAQVATLPSDILVQLRQELNLDPIEYARLQAAVEADAFLRLMVYHNYTSETNDEAANKSNAVFANALKDKLATGGKSESVYPALAGMEAAHAVVPPPRRRGRGRPKLGSGSAAAAVPTEAQ